MAGAFGVFILAVSFIFLRACGGRELFATYKEELMPSSFKSKAKIETAADESVSARRIRRRFIMDEGKELAADRKTEEAKETTELTSEISESLESKLPQRSISPPPASVSWRISKKKPSKSEKLPGFDSDYCQPRTHPPAHN